MILKSSSEGMDFDFEFGGAMLYWFKIGDRIVLGTTKRRIIRGTRQI